MTSRRMLAFVPLLIFAGLAALFFIQLSRGGGSNVVPSALIGAAVPQVELAALDGLKNSGVQVPGLSPDQMKGRVSIVNIWASWCAPCRAEHPILVELSEDERFQVIGINYKDKPSNALRFLGSLGNPYDIVGVDEDGRSSIEWGVYGVPETFIVDADGKIAHKHVGPLSTASMESSFMPALSEVLASRPSAILKPD
ncbi:MAG: DsbE family thiol:disulfide interchange protein [Alphaproteobacteria bacterium]